jgi:phosphoglycolate phosphatase-like HAD superfamily hydrolase
VKIILKQKGIFFDLDGTLIHFKIDYIRARTAVINILEQAGYPKGELNLKDLIFSMVEKAHHYFVEEIGQTEEKFERIRKEINEVVEEVEREAAEKASPVEGIIEILEFLKAEQFTRAIITFNSTQNALLSIKKAGLDAYFNPRFIVGRDLVSKPKPHPDHVNELLNRTGLTAKDICIIGDHPRDIEAAVNIQAPSIAVITPMHQPQEFQTPFYCYQTEYNPKMKEQIKKIFNL